MQLRELKNLRVQHASNELVFSWGQIYLQDLAYYTDGILVDGDTQSLVFDLNDQSDLNSDHLLFN